MVYRSLNNEVPIYPTSLLRRLSQNTTKELRNTKTDLKLPLLKTSSVLIEEHNSETVQVLMSHMHKRKINFKNSFKINKEFFR